MPYNKISFLRKNKTRENEVCEYLGLPTSLRIISKDRHHVLILIFLPTVNKENLKSFLAAMGADIVTDIKVVHLTSVIVFISLNLL
jgi:hypothetical protein